MFQYVVRVHTAIEHNQYERKRWIGWYQTAQHIYGGDVKIG